MSEREAALQALLPVCPPLLSQAETERRMRRIPAALRGIPLEVSSLEVLAAVHRAQKAAGGRAIAIRMEELAKSLRCEPRAAESVFNDLVNQGFIEERRSYLMWRRYKLNIS
jgi:DNA-binding MarR family transcriptional regulator